MKPILLAAIAAALTTNGLTADDPKPGTSPVPNKAAPAEEAPADKSQPKVDPAGPSDVPPKLDPPKLIPPPDPLTPPVEKPSEDKTDPPKTIPEVKPDDDKTVPAKNVDPTTEDPEKKNKDVGEIKQKGPLHFATGQNLPLNGKMVIFGDDGVKQREVVYKDGKIQSWIEWQTEDVKIERTYQDGHEVKRTGWKGDMKWFEISFGTDADGNHAKTAPKTVGSDPEPKKADPDDPNAVAKVEPVQKNKWPAFVPGNPIFPEPAKKDDETKTESDIDAPSNLDKLKGALTNPETKDSPKDNAEESKNDDDVKIPTEAQDTSKKNAPPGFLEIRDNELVYSNDSNVPFSGKSTLYKIDFAKIYFGLLKNAESINSLSHIFSESDLQEMSETELRKLLRENLSEQDLLSLSLAGHGLAHKQFEGEFTDGRRNGLGIEYYPDGTKKYVGVFKGGELHDGWVYWYYYGTTQKKMETQYKGGQLFEAHSWSRDGVLRW